MSDADVFAAYEAGVAMTNNTGMDLMMNLFAGTVTGLNRNGGGVLPWGTNSIEFWPADQTRAITYSVAPSMSFQVLG